MTLLHCYCLQDLVTVTGHLAVCIIYPVTLPGHAGSMVSFTTCYSLRSHSCVTVTLLLQSVTLLLSRLWDTLPLFSQPLFAVLGYPITVLVPDPSSLVWFTTMLLFTTSCYNPGRSGVVMIFVTPSDTVVTLGFRTSCHSSWYCYDLLLFFFCVTLQPCHFWSHICVVISVLYFSWSLRSCHACRSHCGCYYSYRIGMSHRGIYY